MKAFVTVLSVETRDFPVAVRATREEAERLAREAETTINAGTLHPAVAKALDGHPDRRFFERSHMFHMRVYEFGDDGLVVASCVVLPGLREEVAS